MATTVAMRAPHSKMNYALQYPENESFSIAPEALATIVSLLQRIVSILAEVAAVALLFAAVPAIKKTWNLLSKKTEKSEVESF